MSKSSKSEKPIKVAILTTAKVALFELGCAVELFAMPRLEFDNWYQSEVVTFEGDKQLAAGGLSISSRLIDSLYGYHTLVIPSWPVEQAVSKQLIDQLNEFNERGGRIITFCSGAFVLGKVGLLDNRKATTHWRYAEQFKKQFAHSHYIENSLYVFADNIGCSAGSSAAIDLGIEVIRQDFGYEVANHVARRLVIAAHRSGGQSQYVEAPIPKSNRNFSKVLDWAVENINQKIDVGILASKAHMSRRTFDRQFRKSLDMSPKEWIIKQRLKRAKELLESTKIGIERVSYCAGFETSENMRHHFRKNLQISPIRYRRQFKSGTTHSSSGACV
jgi:AraC family transcriptional activator FtrA